MKEIVVYDVPPGANVLIAHDTEDIEGAVIPQSHIIEIYSHTGGIFHLQYNDYRRLFIRIRHSYWHQVELKTMDIPPNNVAYRRMIPDLAFS